MKMSASSDSEYHPRDKWQRKRGSLRKSAHDGSVSEAGAHAAVSRGAPAPSAGLRGLTVACHSPYLESLRFDDDSAELQQARAEILERFRAVYGPRTDSRRTLFEVLQGQRVMCVELKGQDKRVALYSPRKVRCLASGRLEGSSGNVRCSCGQLMGRCNFEHHAGQGTLRNPSYSILLFDLQLALHDVELMCCKGGVARGPVELFQLVNGSPRARPEAPAAVAGPTLRIRIATNRREDSDAAVQPTVEPIVLPDAAGDTRVRLRVRQDAGALPAAGAAPGPPPGSAAAPSHTSSQQTEATSAQTDSSSQSGLEPGHQAPAQQPEPGVKLQPSLGQEQRESQLKADAVSPTARKRARSLSPDRALPSVAPAPGPVAAGSSVAKAQAVYSALLRNAESLAQRQAQSAKLALLEKENLQLQASLAQVRQELEARDAVADRMALMRDSEVKDMRRELDEYRKQVAVLKEQRDTLMQNNATLQQQNSELNAMFENLGATFGMLTDTPGADSLDADVGGDAS